MKKITLSNLINLTEEDIRNIEPILIDNVNSINCVIINTTGIRDLYDNFYNLHLDKFEKGSFSYILAVKDALKIVDEAINFYNTYLDIFGKIHLNTNDKIYVAKLQVDKWYRNYMYFLNNDIIND